MPPGPVVYLISQPSGSHSIGAGWKARCDVSDEEAAGERLLDLSGAKMVTLGVGEVGNEVELCG